MRVTYQKVKDLVQCHKNIRGENNIIVSLIEADLSVDSGDIYIQKIIYLNNDELVDDWRKFYAFQQNN